MHYIILLEKYSQNFEFWKNLIKFNKTILNLEDVIKNYKGFEGELLLFATYKENDLNDLLKFNKEKGKSFVKLLLHLLTDSSQMPDKLKKNALFYGFDIGVCDGEKTVYSSIFNEILFGNLEELISFQKYLNENLLFPNKTLAEKYLNLHNEFSFQGKGVEDYEQMNIYEVWGQQI